MSAEITKVGIVSCSGEAIAEGTISRLATRRVLELLRPDKTVTICLPLFLAGNDGEQNFAKTHPTITVDGCSKQCARWGTEQHSGPVSGALVVSEILGTAASGCSRSARHPSPADKEAVWIVAERIAADVDRILAEEAPAYEGVATDGGDCDCSKPVPGMSVRINDADVTIPGLQLIFEQCLNRSVPADDDGSADLLTAAKIYHRISAEDEAAYRPALLAAYQRFIRTRSR